MTTTTEAIPQAVPDGVPAVATLATRARDWATRAPDQVAMRHKHLGIWREITWADYWDTVQNVAYAFLDLGVQPGDRVAIHSENRPEWLFTDVATVAVRGATVGFYPTNPAAEVSYLLSHSGAKILIAEDQEQLDKALAVLDSCPDLEHIVYVDPRGIHGSYGTTPGATRPAPSLLSWNELVDRGAAHRAAHPDALRDRMTDAEQDDVATLIYTSGTTGPPKGAILTTANVEFAVRVQAGGAITEPPPNPDDMLLSYLPLCHVVERTFTTWFNLGAGAQVNFAESIDTVQANLAEIQPTILFSVPRIWEKMLAGVQIKLGSATRPKRLLARFWLRVATWIGDTLVRTGGRHTVASRLAYSVGWVCWYRALRTRLGMRRVRVAVSGAAPIGSDVLKFFMGIGVPMFEAYGLTETAAIATANKPGRVKLGTVGERLTDEVEVRVDDTGEILVRHGGVFAGYFNDPEATAGSLTPDGWLRTGDVGELVDDSHIKITDRKKDIIITAGGKNVAPSEIENALKTSPFIKEVIVIGDRRPYLAALIGIELDTVGEWAQRRRLDYTTYRDLSEKPEVVELVRTIVDNVNSRFASVEQIKRFRLLPKELDHEDGELTATQKVKRAAIAERFGDLVDDLYPART